MQELNGQVEGLEKVYERDLARTGMSPDEWPARQAQLDADYEEKRGKLRERRGELQALLDQSISLELASAELDRLSQIRKNRLQEIGELETRIAVLRERIKTAAQEGVEEAVSEVKGQLETAQARKAAYEAEIAALRRLKAAVETEVARLKERYLHPVNKEIRPLLELFYPEASLDFDEEKLIPRQLTRDGVSEDIQALSFSPVASGPSGIWAEPCFSFSAVHAHKSRSLDRAGRDRAKAFGDRCAGEAGETGGAERCRAWSDGSPSK